MTSPSSGDLPTRPGFSCRDGRENTVVLITPEDGVTPILDLRSTALQSFSGWEFSPDGEDLYFYAITRDRWQGVWSVPATGGEPRLVVDFEDSNLHMYSNGLTVGPGYLHLSIGVYESDIWVMDLEW